MPSVPDTTVTLRSLKFLIDTAIQASLDEPGRTSFEAYEELQMLLDTPITVELLGREFKLAHDLDDPWSRDSNGQGEALRLHALPTP